MRKGKKTFQGVFRTFFSNLKPICIRGSGSVFKIGSESSIRSANTDPIRIRIRNPAEESSPWFPENLISLMRSFSHGSRNSFHLTDPRLPTFVRLVWGASWLRVAALNPDPCWSVLICHPGSGSVLIKISWIRIRNWDYGKRSTRAKIAPNNEYFYLLSVLIIIDSIYKGLNAFFKPWK